MTFSPPPISPVDPPITELPTKSTSYSIFDPNTSPSHHHLPASSLPFNLVLDLSAALSDLSPPHPTSLRLIFFDRQLLPQPNTLPETPRLSFVSLPFPQTTTMSASDLHGGSSQPLLASPLLRDTLPSINVTGNYNPSLLHII